MRLDKELVAASATPLVLGILAGGEAHGYAIARRIEELTDGQLSWAEGMLYPLLHRLDRLGYVTSHWATGPAGRRRRIYAITEKGAAALAERTTQWAVVSAALSKLAAPGPPVASPRLGTADLALPRLVGVMA